MSGLILQYAFNYTDQHRPILSKFTEMMPLANYLDRQNLVNDSQTMLRATDYGVGT